MDIYKENMKKKVNMVVKDEFYMMLVKTLVASFFLSLSTGFEIGYTFGITLLYI